MLGLAQTNEQANKQNTNPQDTGQGSSRWRDYISVHSLLLSSENRLPSCPDSYKCSLDRFLEERTSPQEGKGWQREEPALCHSSSSRFGIGHAPWSPHSFPATVRQLNKREGLYREFGRTEMCTEFGSLIASLNCPTSQALCCFPF